MSLVAGTKLGPYEILAPIGAGGMGEVYKARDTRLGRVVAIKLLPPDKIADPERKRRFVQEARAASALNHPNIVTIYDIGSEDGADFIVMEYIEGKSLDRVIPRGGMRLTEALNTVIPVADALAKAHASGIIHRDLKPANILVTDDGTVKLLDFGLAKLIEDKPSSTAAPGESAATVTLGAAPDAPLTEEGAILGTVAYMSPEQAEGKTIDARSDIFSFGSVLYEMLTGQKAFQGGSRAATIAAILKEDPAPLGDSAPAIPRELERMIARCLRKDPAKRWQTAADLRTSLQEFKDDSDSGLTRSGASGIASATAPPLRSHKLAWGIAAVSVIAALGVTLWAVRGSRAATDTSASATLHPVPLTAYQGDESDPYFSPDGTQVAFSWDGEQRDNFDIYVKRIGPGPPLRLTHDPAPDNYPAWAPDGSAIAFLRQSASGRNKIMLIPPLGGPEREVADVAAVQAIHEALEWTGDGKWLIAFDRPTNQAGGLFLISPESGQRKRLTTTVDASVNVGETSAAVSPDGRTLAFVRQFAGNAADLFLLPLRMDYSPDGEPRRLTNQKQVMTGATWQLDGRAVMVSWGEPGNEPLWRIPIDDPVKAIQLTDQDETSSASLSRILSRFVYSQSTREMDIYRVELSADGFDARGAKPVAASSRFDRRPSFSPDGKKIAFASVRSGKWQLWISASDGTDPIALSSFERGEVVYPTWSPDGQQIVFSDNAEGESAAYIVDASGGRPRKLDALGEVEGIHYSQDGKWFYYISNAGGAAQVWKIPVTGGMPVQLTHVGVGNRQVSVSPDDSLIYFTRPGAIWSVPTDGGPEHLVVEYNLDAIAGPAVSRQGLYFVAGTTTRRAGEMLFFPFPNGPVRKVTGIDKPSRYGHAISTDGRYLLYTKMVSEGNDLMLVENFK